ncbi:RING finger domain protein [Rutstroemia sp. NJR-2017a BVV2]|nr:RING finger domain protein [Rutstroemia sp. NJR-2017a BVV2]
MDSPHSTDLATKPEVLDNDGRLSPPVAEPTSSSAVPKPEPEQEETVCVICLEKLSEPAVTQPCNHSTFDYLCLLTWLQQSPSCPLCKTQIKTVHYDTLEGGKPKTYIVPAPAREPPTQNPNYNRASLHHASRNRRRLRFGPRPAASHPSATLDDPIARRRHIYRHQLFSLHVGSNRISRFRELTPQLFVHDAEAVSRARNWIRRELQVFEFLHPSSSSGAGETSRAADRRANNAEFLLEYIIAILKTTDIQESGGKAEELLGEYLGTEDARLFLHELRAWLRSPYTTLGDWDRHVQYRDVGRVVRGKYEREGERGRRGDEEEVEDRGGRIGESWRPEPGRYGR